MYIGGFSIKNIKCFQDAELSFPHTGGSYAGWNVILGINGTGKSTLLQAIALTMLGPVSGGRLLPQPAPWVRAGEKYGEMRAALVSGTHDSISSGAPRKKPYDAHLVVTGSEPVTVRGAEFPVPQVALYDRSLAKSLNSGPFSNRKGWFSAGYGPFRRLTGSGGEDDVSVQYGQGHEARHLTLFRESAALTRCEKWLITLHSQSIDPALSNHAELKERLAHARKLIDGLLPQGVCIDAITAAQVTFKSRAGVKVLLSQLSDGYRSFLALAIDLLRHVLDNNEYGAVKATGDQGSISIDCEGIVLIDEADAHLHPSWQRDIGTRMVATFPKVQFIVTSHSPFVAQAAMDGGLFTVKGAAQFAVIGQASSPVRGWRADQILLSPLFGLDSTRDPETEKLLNRQTELRGKSDALSLGEQRELNRISNLLSKRLTAPGDTAKERERHRQMQLFIDERLGPAGAGGTR